MSLRTVEILEYDEFGYPLRSVQSLGNPTNPAEVTTFVAEYEYDECDC